LLHRFDPDFITIENINSMNKPFTLTARLHSFKYAVKGIRILLSTQHNAWIHVLATVAVGLLGLYFGVTQSEWCWLVLAITLVWTAEGFNTALELLADASFPNHHTLVGYAKDVAAGAVLLAAIGAVIIGMIIMVPYLW
jgi:diacylglycerol kinase (ATP)